MSATLSAFDRCDACGFQAFVMATRDGQVLLFCGHHGTEHRLTLQARGWLVTDQLGQDFVPPYTPALLQALSTG